MADDKIVVQIQLDDGTIKQGFVEIKNQANETANRIEKDFDKGGLSVGKLASGVALGQLAFEGISRATRVFTNALSSGIEEAIEAENSINRLSSALSLQGNFSKEAIDSFTEFANTLSNVTGIEDDLIISNAGLLASIGNLSGKGLERATKAALDLSQATGKDLDGVTQALAKAANGSTEALSRYGVKIDESIPKAERFGVALDLIQRRFGGLAESRLNTFAGSLDLVAIKFNDLIKVFGELITKSPIVRAVLKTTGELLGKLAEYVESLFKNKDPFGNLIKSGLIFAQFFTTKILPPVEIFFNFFKTGALTISTFALGVVRSFLFIWRSFSENVIIPIVSFFTDKLASIIGIFSEETETKLRDLGQGIVSTYRKTSDELSVVTGELFDASANALVDSSKTVLETKTSDFLTGIVNQYQSAVNSAKKTAAQLPQLEESAAGFIGPMPFEGIQTASQGFTSVLDGMSMATDEFAKNSVKNFQEVGKSMFMSLGQGAGNAFAAFGKAIVKGKNALAAFAGALLGTLGQAAVQLGSMFILQGLAYLYAGYPNGPALIAAGAGLAAIGGVLSAIGSGDSGGAGVSTSVGGGTDATSLGAPELEAAPQRQAATTQVIIQGDVLDSDNTGSRIVELIRQYTDKNGEAALA